MSPGCESGLVRGMLIHAAKNMKSSSFLKLITVALLSAGVGSIAHAQTLIAGWDFQTTSGGGTAAAAAPGSPLTYVANFSVVSTITPTLYLNGTNGSSTWTSLASNPQVTSFGGSSVNTSGTSFSTTTSGAASLALANSSSNGNAAVFKFSMTGFKDLSISYSTQATATGFNLQTWEYSTNGSTWSSIGTFNPRPTGATTFATVGVVTLPTVTGLDSIGIAYVRLVVSGATATAGNNRFDNIQFNATAIPEPSTCALLLGGFALTGGIVLRRRRACSAA